MEECRFAIDDTYVHYVHFGRGAEPAVILSGVSLCGFEGQGAALAKAVEPCGELYDCYILDRRVKMRKGFTVFDMAEDVYELLKSRGIEKAKFIGASQGGMFAQALALTHPELVEKIVFTSTSAAPTEVSRRTMKEWRSYLEKDDVSGFNMCFYRSIYSHKFVEDNLRALTRLARIGTPEQCRRFEVLIDSIEEYDVLDRLGEIKCPCKVFGAELDECIGVEGAVRLAEGLGAPLHIYEGASHAAYDEVKGFYTEATAFLEGEE